MGSPLYQAQKTLIPKGTLDIATSLPGFPSEHSEHDGDIPYMSVPQWQSSCLQCTLTQLAFMGILYLQFALP